MAKNSNRYNDDYEDEWEKDFTDRKRYDKNKRSIRQARKTKRKEREIFLDDDHFSYD